MLQMWLACARWREDGPWLGSVVRHLRVDLRAALMDVDQLSALARALDRCPGCGGGIYVMMNDPRSDHVQQPQHDDDQQHE